MTNSEGGEPRLLNDRYSILQVLRTGEGCRSFLVADTQGASDYTCALKKYALKKYALKKYALKKYALKKYVLKQINCLDNDPFYETIQERFNREAGILKQVGGYLGQIPYLLNSSSKSEQEYLVEEWIEGQNLLQWVQDQGQRSETEVRLLLLKILPAIAHLHHNQIVHQHLHPENILLRTTDQVPVLIDFGAVQQSIEPDLPDQRLSAGWMRASPSGYAPPEQITECPTLASDIYSLGLTAIYLLTGKHPHQLYPDFQQGRLLWQSYAPQVSSEFAALLNQAIRFDSRQRFAHAQDMRIALQAIMHQPAAPEAASAPPIPQPAPVIPVPTSIAMPSGEVPPTNPLPPLFPPATIPALSFTPPAFAPLVTELTTTGLTAQVLQTLVPASRSWQFKLALSAVIGAAIVSGALPPLFFYWQNREAHSTQVPPTASPSIPPPPMPTADPSVPHDSSITAVRPVPDSLVPNSLVPNSLVPNSPAPEHPMRLSPAPDNSAIERPMPESPEGFALDTPAPDTSASANKTNPSLSRRSLQPAPETIPEIIPQTTPKTTPDSIALSPAMPSPASPASSRLAVEPSPAKATATIANWEAESANIRSGPGTEYSVENEAYPGDRVRILNSGQDQEGYTWYQVQ
nr:protein kinase [Oculatellaceae cyanobacterium Prado106]